MYTPWPTARLVLNNEQRRLLDRMPQLGGRVLNIAYLYSHELDVRYINGRSTRVAVSDWMSDECLARIALECP